MAVKGRSKVLHGDCLKLMPSVAERYGKPKLIFCDPPFNLGQNYSGYADSMDEMEFDLWIGKVVRTCWHILADDGILAMHGPDRLAELYLQAARRFQMNRIAWVNWHYRFGQNHRSSWPNTREHCLIFAKGKTWTWNPDAVLVDSDRAAVYGDKRTEESKTPGMRLPGTIWGIPSDGPHWGRITGAHSNKERQPECPNQLPENYIIRLLRAYSNPGDLVLDPFAGSGTTATVAVALGRNAITMDVSERNVEIVKARIRKGAVRV